MPYLRSRPSRLSRTTVLGTCLWLACYAHLSPAQDDPKPCATDAHRQFDFWIGEWEVYDPEGKKAGTSRIESILGGCVIFENWSSAGSAYAGKSFNTFDPVSQSWKQVWVDTGGNTIHFTGSRNANVMAMTGTHTTGRGTASYRMSYTLNDDGTVRQHWQQSTDGAAWQTIFDGTYRRLE